VRDGIFVDPLACAGVGLFGIVVILVCMWGLKEKASELIQRVMDYFDAPRLFFYLFIFFILSLFIFFKYAYSYPFQIDDESAMYFLSALVQSQAAILAIVITLTLIAVQLASSHYSPRVIDIFKKAPAIWWFLCYYGISIFFGLCILMMMQVLQNETIVIPIVLNRYSLHISFEHWIYAAYLIAITTFVVLFGYMRSVFDLLKPSNIIKKLSDNITKEKISKHIKSLEEHKKDRTKPIEEDPVQPIVDIIRSSLIKHDFATTSSGINTITNRAIEVMNPNEHKISKHFCDHFERIGKLAVNRGDEESVIEVIKNLEAFGESAAKRESVVTIADVAKCTRSIGKTAAEKRYADATRQAILCIRSVGKTTTESSTGNLLDGAVYQVARSIGAVGLSAEENGLRAEVWQAARALVLVGIFAEGKRFENAKQQALECLVRLATSSKEIVESAIETTRSALSEEDHDFKVRITSTQQTTKKRPPHDPTEAEAKCIQPTHHPHPRERHEGSGTLADAIPRFGIRRFVSLKGVNNFTDQN